MRRGWQPDPAVWGLERRNARLCMEGHDLADLAQQYGTPLYVASTTALRARCAELARAFERYPGRVALRFSYKCNPVAGLLRVVHACGVGAEVCGSHELWLARQLGVAGKEIVFNGPNKSDSDLSAAIASGVGLVVVEDVEEVRRLERIAAVHGSVVRIALRVRPDLRPDGINPSFLTGARGSHFGLDRCGPEIERAADTVLACPHLRLCGAMGHMASGIQHIASFETLVQRLLAANHAMRARGAEPCLLDLGGGLGARHGRPFGPWEMLVQLGTGRLPPLHPPAPADLVQRYATVICDTVTRTSRSLGLEIPELVLEPGRAIASDAQVLLLSVGAVRKPSGRARVAFADGGAVSASMMLLSEHHAVLLANRTAPDDGRPTDVYGPLPSPMDVLYRGLRLPELRRGDVLAVMDAGAYFIPSATHFAGPRAAVVLLEGGEARLVRRRETSEDLARLELSLHE